MHTGRTCILLVQLLIRIEPLGLLGCLFKVLRLELQKICIGCAAVAGRAHCFLLSDDLQGWPLVRTLTSLLGANTLSLSQYLPSVLFPPLGDKWKLAERLLHQQPGLDHSLVL